MSRCTLLLLCLSLPLAAEPIVPSDDAQVIERLPPAPRIGSGTDPQQAARDAMVLLDEARSEGDPRLAGRALARLARWQRDADAPPEVVIALASAEQYIHRFAAAIERLQAFVRRDPAQPQAWLMLATLHRAQGRYGESDAACGEVQRYAPPPYGRACLAENHALRGQFDGARAELRALRARASSNALRAWLSTTLAEMEGRAGQPLAAEAAWRDALAAAPDDGYALVGWADFLLAQGRPQEAWAALQSALRNDNVLLRLAIAARRAQRPEADALNRELHERFAQADLRPEASGHERERAMAALALDERPRAALALAQRNAAWQREPIDLLLLARCAQAAGDDAALREARALAARVGMVDTRWPGG
jgi:Tfp pilus assembly protein PilF